MIISSLHLPNAYISSARHRRHSFTSPSRRPCVRHPRPPHRIPLSCTSLTGSGSASPAPSRRYSYLSYYGFIHLLLQLFPLWLTGLIFFLRFPSLGLSLLFTFVSDSSFRFFLSGSCRFVCIGEEGRMNPFAGVGELCLFGIQSR